ncbi:DUF4234 domain-containing protein [Actinomycetospora chiangmaiensis]|uniref:DUF4234 domain-containing protein n=1 Tax=Actinomycetospora chiangmaiensis TaxID=402650 RepID=UPI00037C779D|nr:DUF4234 domain-containing protein [Actinomycetospora chiangmaiensis]
MTAWSPQPPEASAVTDRLYIPAQYQQPAVSPAGGLPQQVPTGLAMKRRNPGGVWLGLPFITFGVYSYVWYYKIHREMAEFDRRRVVPVAGPMLVLLFLGWTVVAPLVSLYNTGNRIAAAQRAAGLRPTCSAGIGLLLCFAFGLVSLYYQSELNKVVDSYPGAWAGSSVPLRG